MEIKLSRYTFESLWSDKEFHLCRGRGRADRSSRSRQEVSSSCVAFGKEEPSSEGRQDLGPPSILFLSPVAEQPAFLTVKRLEHEYSLRDELDPEWAIRPLTLTRHDGRPVLVFEDPGSELLERFLGEPIELGRFLRLAINLAAGLDKLHGRGLMHKISSPLTFFLILKLIKSGSPVSESVRVWLANDRRLNLRT